MAPRKSKTKAARNRKPKTIPWDSAAYLKTESDIGDYLEAVFEDGDPELIAHALGIVARAKGMTKIARATGLGRESLYKALSLGGNPVTRHRIEGDASVGPQAESRCVTD